MKKLGKKTHKTTASVEVYGECYCYYPCQCTATPSTAFVRTKNELTTRMNTGVYMQNW